MRLGLIGRIVGLALVLPLVVLLGLNVFVNLWLPVLLNLQPERVRITYDVAWMLIPGQVEVRQLRIRSQSPRDQLVIDADRASATVDLPLLVDRTFRAHTLRAQGVSFRFRVRTDAPQVPAGPPVAAIGLPGVEELKLPAPPPPLVVAPPPLVVAPVAPRTPPIEGLLNPPVPAPEAIYPPPPGFWTVVLEDVVVEDLREIWLEDYHYVGDARVTAAEFVLQPTVHVSTKDAVLEFADGQVLLGEDAMLVGLHGKVDVRLDELRIADNVGRSVLGFLSVHAALDATVKNLDFLDFYLRKAPWFDLSGGAGDLHVDVKMDRGRFLEGSLLTARVDDIASRFLSYSIVGDGGVRFEVAAGADGAPESRLAVDFGDYAITRDGDATPHVEGTGFRVSARTADVAMDAPFTALTVVLELPDSEIRDVGVYNAFLPRGIGLALQDGRGRVRGRLEVSTVGNVGHGELFVTGTRIRASLDELTLLGDVALHAVIPEGRVGEGWYDISGSRLDLRNVSITSSSNLRGGKDVSRSWWAAVSLPRGHAAAGAAVFLDANLAVKFRDSVPFITIFSEKHPLPGWARGLLAIDDVSGEARIRLGDDVLHLPSFEVRGAKGFALSLELRRKQLLFFGKLYAQYGNLSLGMQILGAENKVQLFNAREWYDQQPSVE
ncbi:MAG: hypothetical protein Q8P41_20340 [Pseudomonadota bacterium]|nr:hypothetical protein [Pseudomonadota bacterium]